MKVVGLVSGGKDSCYAMMRCIDYGHEIVALANLLPLEDSVDELDSYMYQTVGHQIVVSYAQCMGLPLFRRRIRGTPRHQQLKYIQTQGDEVEDLLILLNEVKRQIPAIQGVSSGAIASDYQRLRVESVCSRLGFVSLAFLWKQEQTLLLQEMIEKGVEAIVIKVAAIGLHPNKHLARDLVDLQPHLLQLNELYGINVCGEGGEYETLTLDCPLFKNARIVVDEFQVVLHSSDSIAPVGILHPSAFHLEPKSGNLVPGTGNEETFINISTTDWVHEVEGNDITSGCKADNELSKPAWDPDTIDLLNLIVSKTQSDIITVGCWLQDGPKAMQGLENHLGLILKGIESRLTEEHLGWEDVLYIHLYLADMNQFASANDTYVRYITEGNCPRGVPSRSTIAIPLAEGGLGNAMVEVLAAKDRSKRVLHVQSMSCWAPNCIGPYSQATLHRQILYMAGQLGFDPPTMALTPGGAAAQMQQAIINCEAVANTFNCSLHSSLVSVTVYCPVSVTLDERNEIQDRLEKFLQQKPALGEDLSRDTKKVKISHPLILYVLVSMLPKSALVELKPFLYVPASEDEDKFVDKFTCCMGTENDHWDSGNDRWISSCCEIFALCGHICASTVSITSESIRKFCNERHHDVLSQSISWNLAEQKQFLMNVAKFCIHAQDKMLQEACLYWEDVVNFRVYFIVKVTSTDTLREAFIEAFGCMSAELRRLNREGMLFDDELSPQFFVCSFIPVLGIGGNTDMTNLITCELFASHF